MALPSNFFLEIWSLILSLILISSGELVIEWQELNLNGVEHGQNADCLTSDRIVIEQNIRSLGWRQIRRYC